VHVRPFLPVPFFRFAVNSGMARVFMALEKKVFCLVGVTWLMVSKAKPRSPEEAVSFENEVDTLVADSTAWLVTVTPPTVTVSMYTFPDELLLSPYVMAHVDPVSLFAVLLLPISYCFCPFFCTVGVSLLKTHKSEDPVSKSRFRVCGGVPIWTAARYSLSKSCGTAETSPIYA
jgi:hypothetical protein